MWSNFLKLLSTILRNTWCFREASWASHIFFWRVASHIFWTGNVPGSWLDIIDGNMWPVSQIRRNFENIISWLNCNGLSWEMRHYLEKVGRPEWNAEMKAIILPEEIIRTLAYVPLCSGICYYCLIGPWFCKNWNRHCWGQYRQMNKNQFCGRRKTNLLLL